MICAGGRGVLRFVAFRPRVVVFVAPALALSPPRGVPPPSPSSTSAMAIRRLADSIALGPRGLPKLIVTGRCSPSPRHPGRAIGRHRLTDVGAAAAPREGLKSAPPSPHPLALHTQHAFPLSHHQPTSVWLPSFILNPRGAPPDRPLCVPSPIATTPFGSSQTARPTPLPRGRASVARACPARSFCSLSTRAARLGDSVGSARSHAVSETRESSLSAIAPPFRRPIEIAQSWRRPTRPRPRSARCCLGCRSRPSARDPRS